MTMSTFLITLRVETERPMLELLQLDEINLATNTGNRLLDINPHREGSDGTILSVGVQQVSP